MLKHYIVRLLLGVGFCLLAFAPPKTVATLLGTKTESRLWAKLAGYLGLFSVALGIISPDHFAIVHATPNGEGFLLTLKYTCGGVVIGLLVAICTKRQEKF